MKKLTTLLAAASLLTLGLASCQDDDTDTIVLSTVAGDFTGSEACPGPSKGTEGSNLYQVHIFNQNDATNKKVFIENVYGIGERYEATVDGKNITLAPTPYEYIDRTDTLRGNISATGMVDGSVLTLNFKLDGDDTSECQFIGDRNYRNPSDGN